MPDYTEYLNMFPVNVTPEWNTESADLDLKEKVRKDLVQQFPWLASRRDYTDPASYNGWVEMPVIGTVAFIERESSGNDGAVIYRW